MRPQRCADQPCRRLLTLSELLQRLTAAGKSQALLDLESGPFGGTETWLPGLHYAAKAHPILSFVPCNGGLYT